MARINVSTKTYPDTFSIIDDDSPKDVFKYKWFVRISKNKKLYVCRDVHLGMKNGRQVKKRVWLHRIINGTPDGEDTDYINQNTLDNRKKNLRSVNRSQNNFNVDMWKHNTSGYKGVTWDRFRNKWVAQIQINGKHIFLGRFTKLQDAVKTRYLANKKYVY